MLLAITNIGGVNLALNVVPVIGLLLVAIPALKRKRLKETVNDLNDSLEARDHRIQDLTAERDACRAQMRQIEHAAQHLKEELRDAQARYEEQGKYTAENALDAVLRVMEHADAGNKRRHNEIMKALESLATVVKR